MGNSIYCREDRRGEIEQKRRMFLSENSTGCWFLFWCLVLIDFSQRVGGAYFLGRRGCLAKNHGSYNKMSVMIQNISRRE